MFRDHYNMPLIHADESDLFLGALEGVSDPEVKRKTIGKLFIDVFQKYAQRSAARSSWRRARFTPT
jgi:GMP synthase (glutamine-hydrolysing)